MAKKRIFVSFDYDNDKEYKFLLRAWDSNLNFDFSFNDQSSGEINSDNISKVKAALTTKISNSSYLLVIVGRYSNSKHKDFKLIRYTNWQNWEVAKAVELKKKIIVVKLNRVYSSPSELLGVEANWVYSFNQPGIIKAINNAG